MNSLGIDVAKDKLDLCLLLADKRRKSKTVKNSDEGFAKVLAWCQAEGVLPGEVHAVLEGTGVYHRAAAEALFTGGMQVSVVNPLRVRRFAESQGLLSKNDALDAYALARFGQATELHFWQPPTPEVDHLQALLARREAVAQDLQREKNRKEKAEVGKAPAPILKSIGEHLQFLEKALKELDDDIDGFIQTNPTLKEDRALLESIPGVGPRVSALMIFLLRRNSFISAEQLAAYLGLIPVEKHSGTSVRGRPGLSRNGPARVRATLYMAAISAKRCNPHIRALYARLLQRGHHAMSALAAAMRKLAHLCFGVFKNRLPYQHSFANKP
jgi:transposase